MTLPDTVLDTLAATAEYVAGGLADQDETIGSAVRQLQRVVDQRLRLLEQYANLAAVLSANGRPVPPIDPLPRNVDSFAEKLRPGAGGSSGAVDG